MLPFALIASLLIEMDARTHFLLEPALSPGAAAVRRTSLRGRAGLTSGGRRGGFARLGCLR